MSVNKKKCRRLTLEGVQCEMFVGGKANGREADIHGVMQPVCNNHFGKENRMGFITDRIPVQGQLIKTLGPSNPGPITRAYLRKEAYKEGDPVINEIPYINQDPTDYKEDREMKNVTTIISGWNTKIVPDDIMNAVFTVLEAGGTTELIVPGVTTTKWMRKLGSLKKQQVAMLLPLYEAGITQALRLGITVKVVPIIGFDFDRIEMDDEERSMLTFTDKKISWDQYVFFAAKKDMVIYGDMGNIKDDNAVVLY